MSMYTVKPPDPAKAGGIHEMSAGWNDDCKFVDWFVSTDTAGGWHTDRVDLPEDPAMLAAVVRSILDPDRFSTYKAHTRIELMRAILPWAWRCGLIPQPETDPLEDMS